MTSSDFGVKLTLLPPLSHFVTNLGTPFQNDVTCLRTPPPAGLKVVITAYVGLINRGKTFKILHGFNGAKYKVLNKMFLQSIGLSASLALQSFCRQAAGCSQS